MRFNPRTPGGVRHHLNIMEMYFIIVSIHAPRAGCDRLAWSFTSRNISFNPRTPGGVRPYGYRYPCYPRSFNPRTPGGVRPRAVVLPYTLRRFNPRTPGGVRRPGTQKRSLHLLFQSTHPGRGATPNSFMWLYY